jgi:hypothetical protein
MSSDTRLSYSYILEPSIVNNRMGSVTLYRCDKCNQEFTSLETLREHKATGCKNKK